MKKLYELKTKMLFTAVLVALTSYHCRAQDLDVPYVPTPHDVVAAMLDVTNVGPGDYVIDLGSGDGRIVIAAAERGAVGHGIDLNPVRVTEAIENARKAGVEDRVVFLEGDLFEADISNATVITMYLLSSVNLKLRPVLLEVLRPGTRIVSHAFSMGDWEADEHLRVDSRHVYFWTIPADIRGQWEWETNGRRFSMNASQEYQKIELDLNAGNQSLTISDPLLKGEMVTFTASERGGRTFVFNGRVEGKTITGTAHVRTGNSHSIEPWSATLRRR